MAQPAQSPVPSPIAPAITIRDLSVRYGGNYALRDVTLDVPQGTLFALLGPNGSGKSTLLKTLIGLIQPSAGEVRIGGRPPAAARGEIGYVPQAGGGDPAFPITVREVVAMGMYGRRSRFRVPFRGEPAVDEALNAVDLAGFGGRQAGQLSGGQHRRVLLARALVRNPRIMLLDEPAAGLDASADEQLTTLLRRFADEGRTIVVATHDIAGVARHYDQAALLSGTLIASGSVADVLRDDHLHQAFGRQLLALHDIEHGHHDVTFHRDDHE